MSKFVGSNRTREGGRPVVHYQDFKSHINADDWRHKATDIDVSPQLPGIGGNTVQASLENIAAIVASAGTGFISVGMIDGYEGGYASGVYNVGSLDYPTIAEAIAAALIDSRLQNGGTILLLPGIYRTSSTIEIPQGVSLVGDKAGSYIIGQTSGGNSIIKVNAITTGFHINGNSGSGDQLVTVGTGIKQSTIQNLIITDNSDGYVNSGNSTLSGNLNSMIYVERGANLLLDRVSLIGRLNDGSTTNRLKTSLGVYVPNSGLAQGTALSVNNCYFDGQRVPIYFNSVQGSADFLSVKNCKARFYGWESTVSQQLGYDNFVTSSLANIEVDSNYVAGVGSFARTLVYINNVSVTGSDKCSIKITNNSGYSNCTTTEICDYDNADAVYSVMSGNSWSPTRPGSNAWNVVIGQNEGDIIGSEALRIFLNSYVASNRNPVNVILNPGTYSITSNSGTFFGLKLIGNPIGRLYPIINLDLGAGSTDALSNRYVAFGSRLENIYFTSSNNFSSVHVSSGRDFISDTAAEALIVKNCVFVNTNLYPDVYNTATTAFATSSQQGTPSSIITSIENCRFYQSTAFSENWSLYLQNVHNVKLDNCYFHGTGYAVKYGTNFLSTGSYVSNFIINGCHFDLTGVTINASPPSGNPYYLDIVSDQTTFTLSNNLFVVTQTGDTAAAIFSGLTTLDRFINVKVKNVNILNNYFNTPNYTYTSPANHPMAGVYVEWGELVNISNNTFKCGGLPLKVIRNSSATQNACNISNNVFSNFATGSTQTLFDLECDFSLSFNPRVSVFSNTFINNKTAAAELVRHTDVTGAAYNTGALVQIYARGSAINVFNNSVIGPIHTPTGSSFIHMAGLYCNTYNSDAGNTTITNYCNVNNNNINILGSAVVPAGSSNYCSSLHLKSSYLRVQNNYLNFNNVGGATSGFRGCLTLEGLLLSSAGDGIVTGNVFDRISAAGATSSVDRGYVIIDSSTNFRGQIAYNTFTQPTINGIVTTLIEDNTSAANKWISDYNKNQTKTFTLRGVGNVSVAAIAVNGTASSYFYTNTDDGSGRYWQFGYQTADGLQSGQIMFNLSQILPHGASLIGATISYSCSATPTTGTLLFEVDDGGVNTVSNSANLNSSPGPGTVSISPSINVYRSGTESWLKANISINHGSNMLVYITGIEVSYRF